MFEKEEAGIWLKLGAVAVVVLIVTVFDAFALFLTGFLAAALRGSMPTSLMLIAMAVLTGANTWALMTAPKALWQRWMSKRWQREWKRRLTEAMKQPATFMSLPEQRHEAPDPPTD